MSSPYTIHNLSLVRENQPYNTHSTNLIYTVREANGAEYRVDHIWFVSSGSVNQCKAISYTAELKNKMSNMATCLEKRHHGLALTAAQLRLLHNSQNKTTRECIKKSTIEELIAQNKALTAQLKSLQDELAIRNTKLAATQAEVNKLNATLKTVQEQHAVILQKLATLGI